MTALRMALVLKLRLTSRSMPLRPWRCLAPVSCVAAAPDKWASCLPSTLSWVLRYYLPEIAKIFRIRTMPRNRVQHQKGLSDDAFERLYPDEEACRKAWFAWRWP